MDKIGAAEAVINTYADQLAILGKHAVGRPDTVVRNLNALASGAAAQLAQAAGDLGVTLKCDIAHVLPDLVTDDSHDESGHERPQPGRLEPKHNRGFLAAHRANLKRLQRGLAAVEKAAAP